MRMALLFMEHRRSRSLSSRDVLYALRAVGTDEERIRDGRRAVMAYVGGGSEVVFPRGLDQRVRALTSPKNIRLQKTAIVFMAAVLSWSSLDACTQSEKAS